MQTSLLLLICDVCDALSTFFPQGSGESPCNPTIPLLATLLAVLIAALASVLHWVDAEN